MDEAVKLLLQQLPKGAIQTATTDCGKEFSWYNVLEKELYIQGYFADAYSSWQRGVMKMGTAYCGSSSPKNEFR